MVGAPLAFVVGGAMMRQQQRSGRGLEAVSDSNLVVASMQDVRDVLSPLSAPLYVLGGLLAAPWFLLSLIPFSLVATVTLAVLAPLSPEADDSTAIERFLTLVKGVSKDQWLKLAFCVLLDAAGDATDFLPGGFLKSASFKILLTFSSRCGGLGLRPARFRFAPAALRPVTNHTFLGPPRRSPPGIRRPPTRHHRASS